MPRFVRVARVGDLEPGDILGTEVEGVPVALIYFDGRYYALHDECTHRQATLSDGDLEGDILICPWHAGSFDIRTGEAVDTPPTEPVPTYPVQVENGEIRVAVN